VRRGGSPCLKRTTLRPSHGATGSNGLGGGRMKRGPRTGK
jgi:hypothetical protein